jgi:hypothetical protein
MATKTTGSGRGPGLEAWNPNIKAPGINKGTGAYFRGDIAQEGDYAEMNDKIQESILQGAKDAGAALKAFENDPNNPKNANPLLTPGGRGGDGKSAAETDLVIGKIESTATTNTKQQLDEIIANVVNENSEDKRYARKKGKNKTIEYKNLKKDDKILANDRASKIADFNSVIKEHIGKGWVGSDESTIDWGNWGKHQNAQNFMKHLISGDAVYKYEFDKGSSRSVIKYTDEDGNEQEITKLELDVAKDMWGSNVEGVNSYESRFKKDGELAAKNFKETQSKIVNETLADGEEDLAMENRLKNTISSSYKKEDKEYIWSNILANTQMFKGARRAPYDPTGVLTYTDKDGKEQSLLHEEIVNQYLEGKLREYAGFPPKSQKKPETINNNNNNNNNNNKSFTGNTKVFDEIMQMSSYEMEKLPLVKTLNQDLLDGRSIDSSLIPSKLSKKGSVEKQEFDQLKEAYNGNLNDKKLKHIVNWAVKNTKYDTEGNEIGPVWGDYNGSYMDDSKKVFEKWKEIYSNSLGSQVKDESKREEFANLINRGGYELRGKVLDADNPPEITQDEKGRATITFYTKKGEDGLESEPFVISTENGRRALYQALTNATDAKFNQTEADFTAMLKAYIEENK